MTPSSRIILLLAAQLLVSIGLSDGRGVVQSVTKEERSVVTKDARQVTVTLFHTEYTTVTLATPVPTQTSNQSIATLPAVPVSKYGLQEAYGALFDSGVAIIRPDEQLKGKLGDLVKKNFKTLITENMMVWGTLQSSKGKFSWSRPDSLVKWAQANKKDVLGHTLLWNEDGWMTENEDPEVMLAHIEKHIKTVVGRYKGKIKSWNVVNEFFDDNGDLRTDYTFPRVLGVDGIVKAFKWAHETDPSAVLYLNEYHMYLPTKATKVTNLVNALRHQGVPIHGIGIQGHQYDTDNSTGGSARAPTINDFRMALLKCAAIRVRCLITELDVTVLPNKWACCKNTDLSDYPPEVQAEYDPYPDSLPPEKQQMLADRYRDFYAMLLSLPPNSVHGVQAWGLTDAYSWYNNKPIKGRTDYPLLWDRMAAPKLALQSVLQLRGYQ